VRTRTLCAWAVGLVVPWSTVLVGCPGGLAPSAQTGTLRMLITDKPFPFEFIDQATVTLTKVEAHQTDAADGTFITVVYGAQTFNLLELRNGHTDVLADAEMAVGSYDQIRLLVTAGKITLTDGREFPLEVPSGDRTGIKLHLPFSVAEGQQITLLLDVNLSNAFAAIPSGHIDNVDTVREFRFQPSLGMRLINVLNAGSITGVIQDATGAPLADGSDAELSGTVSDPNGTFTLAGLVSGAYRVEFALDGFVDTQVDNVAVQTGEDTALPPVAMTTTVGG
jgi:hypothetical protein